MRTAYRPLFRIRVRHDYYASGRTDDFALNPVPDTRALAGQGFVFRPQADGFSVYAEVVPGTEPPRLARPLDGTDVRFSFACHARNPQLQNITDLPPYRPARTVFVFDNLREDHVDNRLYLGDAPANARVGDAIDLVTGGMLSYRLPAPATGASLTLTDRFGATRWAGTVSIGDAGHPTADVRLDLGQLPGITPGRYTLSDDAGGSARFYYAPGLAGQRPFAIVDVFAGTAGLTPGGTEMVPPAYRFLAGDAIQAIDDYCIAFAARATTWRYRVVKKYDGSNGFDLSGLAVECPTISFDRTLDADRATFTSSAPVRLSETRRNVVLKHGVKEIRALANPGAATPLGRGAAAGTFLSELFVNV